MGRRGIGFVRSAFPPLVRYGLYSIACAPRPKGAAGVGLTLAAWLCYTLGARAIA